MEKLRWPMDVFARETNRLPRPAEWSDRRDKSETGQMTCLRQTGPVPRTQSKIKAETGHIEVTLYITRGCQNPMTTTPS